MNETLSAKGVADILDFTMYPWGNAYFNTTTCATPYYDKPTGLYCWIKECNVAEPPEECFSGNIWCQHGDDECYHDRLEGCVIKNYPSPALYSVFMSCYEANVAAGDNARDSFEQCATEAAIPKSLSSDILSCAQDGSKSGNAIEVANAQATVKLGRAKLGTPWVIVNGKAMDNPNELLEQVCSLYQGPAPIGCQ